MKTSFKILFAVIVQFIFNSYGVFARGGGDNGCFSIGAEAALPMGTFSDNAGTGFGGTIRYELPAGDNLALTVTAGYITWGAKSTSIGTGALSYQYTFTPSAIPIQVGAKYYFDRQQDGFYVQVEAGIHILSTKTDETDIIGTNTTIQSSTEKNTGFSYAPEIGYHLENVDFALRYQLFSQSATTIYTDPVTGFTAISYEPSTGGYLGLRIAYVFGSR